MHSISDLRGIFRVGDVLHPSHVTSVLRSPHRDARNAVGTRGAIPMFFARGNPYDVAGPDLAHRTSLGLGPADARDDIQRLAQGMRMPCRARARLEGYAGRDDPRRRFGGDDWILPDRARKILLGCLARRSRTGEMDVHRLTPCLSLLGSCVA